MRVLFVDDHALIIESLVPYLREIDEKCEVVGVGTLEAALERVGEDWQLVLLDLHMPDVQGFEALDKLKQHLPNTPLVILSGNLDADIIRQALLRGAAGFVPKIARRGAFLHALRGVLAGEPFIPVQVLQSNSSTAPAPVPQKRHDKFDELTPLQAEALRFVVAGKSTREIGQILGVQETKIRVQLRSVYKKIGAKNRAEIVRKVFESGWK